MTSDGTRIQIPLGSLTFDAVDLGPADGEPVMLLHGFPETSWSWRFVQAGLAQAGFRSLAPDLRGYSPGASPTDPAEYARPKLVADVLGFADHMEWDTFHVVGHDWGGALAWYVAGAHPERLRTLTVASTPHPVALDQARKGGPSADGDDQAAKSSYIDVFRTPGSEELILADGGDTFRQTLEGIGLDANSAAHYVGRFAEPADLVGPLNWYRGADLADIQGLGPITTPTMYVWSTDDAALGRTAAEATADHVDGPYRFEVLEGVSHWIPEEAPDALLGVLVPHLASAR